MSHPDPLDWTLLVRAGDMTANAHEVEHLMRERVREGKAAGRGFARLHCSLMSEAARCEEVVWGGRE